jgi:hypothetical protein
MTTITQSTTAGIVLTSPAYTDPVIIDASVDISNASGAAIYARTENWSLQNYGTISGTVGIKLDAGGSVTNVAGGIISGLEIGVDIEGAAGTVINSGTIFAGNTVTEPQTGPGINLSRGGEIINKTTTSVIYGEGNTIYISGGRGIVTNYGTIYNKIGDGIYMNAGGLIVNKTTSSLLETFNGVIRVDSGEGSVINYGTIRSTSIANSGDGFGISLDGGGRVENIGTDALIKAYYTGAAIGGGLGTIFNTGTIIAEGIGTISRAAYLTGGDVLNMDPRAVISCGGGWGVVSHGAAASVINEGTIVGGDGAVILEAGGIVENLGSAALISGGGIAISSESGTVMNQGKIIANGAAGGGDGYIADRAVYLADGGSVTNIGNAAMIEATELGVGVTGGIGTVTNAGTIRVSTPGGDIGEGVVGYFGVFLGAGGRVTNTAHSALILGEQDGVYLQGAAAEVVNDGTIIATDTAGIGIDFATTGTIANDFSNTVINAGTIIGGSAGMAIQFGAGNDVLEIDPGAVFIGGVDGGTGSDELELAEGSRPGTFSGFGTQFTNFETIVVHAGGTWTFTGTNRVAPGARFAEAGALIDTGLLSIAGTGTWAGVTSGAGTLTFTGGRDTFETGARLEVAHWTLSGTARATINTALDYGGKLTDGAGSSVLIGAGETFTLLSGGSAGGGGTIEIGAEAHLNVSGEITSSQKIAFEASSGTLELADPAAFTAGIAGFARGDRIDIRAAGFSYSPSETVSFTENAAKTEGTLTIKDGAAVFALTLFGQYVAADFKLATDSHGGTLVTYSTTSANNAALQIASPGH